MGNSEKKLLIWFYEPVKSIYTYQYEFYNRFQREEETDTEYMSDLVKLGKKHFKDLMIM